MAGICGGDSGRITAGVGVAAGVFVVIEQQVLLGVVEQFWFEDLTERSCEGVRTGN